MDTGISYRRYIGAVLGLVFGAFALLWLYTYQYRSNFLSAGYGSWRAVIEMVDRCETADVAIIGASQASADIIPDRLDLPMSVRNYALTASTPVEGYYLTRRLYRCPRPPKVAVVVYGGFDLFASSYFWERTARYGLLDFAEMQEVARTAAEVGDRELYHGSFGAEPPPTLKNMLYAIHFPPYDFKSLLAAKGGNRRRENDRLTAETLQQQGHHLISDEPCTDSRSWEADQAAFTPSRLNVAYLDRLLALLRDRDVKVILMSAPMSNLTSRDLSARYVEDYEAFLQRVQDRHRDVTFVGPVFPTMDRCFFSDPMHLNGRGAVAFSRTAGNLISPVVTQRALLRELPGIAVQER